VDNLVQILRPENSGAVNLSAWHATHIHNLKVTHCGDCILFTNVKEAFTIVGNIYHMILTVAITLLTQDFTSHCSSVVGQRGKNSLL